ncbi:MAG: M2 family metallopeptidase, partial [Deltaproteobacteria bacterium]|nr:M2 family metallopeptidase [Deltaproteobacteria bacterium]
MRTPSILIPLALLVAAACSSPPAPAPDLPKPVLPTAAPTAAAFVEAEVAQYQPLVVAAHRAWWEASTTGTDEAFARQTEAEDAVDRFLADSKRFEQVKAYRDDATVTDPMVKRQLEVLYREMLGKQVAPELLGKITTLRAAVTKTFNTYRGTIDGKEVTQNDIKKVLRTSIDGKQLHAAWEAQKGVGALVAPKLAELARLRNQVAKQLGFRDYYALRIAENEQDEDMVLRLFDELDELTRDHFTKHKALVDERLAKRLGIPQSELMPWHYQNPFFQDPPAVFDLGLDEAYQGQDPLKLCRDFYSSIGLETADILARSDLYEKKGKSPHAFCANIDREGDVRVLANVRPGLDWQATMIHELGHAVYEKNVDPKLPWLLRTRTHAITTEGFAMMVDRLVANPHWARAAGAIDDAKRDGALAEARAYLAFAPLQFSRWAQVMLRFERAMYADPSQDLNKLWWDLVERYQGLRRPPGRNAPDYASKIHLVIVPVYYHNYMLGDLFGAQLHEVLAGLEQKDPFAAVYFGNPQVGELLTTKLFASGKLHRWDVLIEQATGKPLSAAAFARR